MASRTGSRVEHAIQEAAGRWRTEERMKGRSALAWIVKEHPENLVAWLWLSRCLAESEEKARRLPQGRPAELARPAH